MTPPAPNPVPPIDRTVGLLGGGQLGRMLALAGYPLGLRFRVLDPSPDAPAGHLASLMCAPYESADLAAFARGLDVVSYEFENVPVAVARALEGHVSVRPGPRALELLQDRVIEKDFMRDLGVPVPGYRAVGSLAELRRAQDELGLPLVLKTRRLGYDGKGQALLREGGELEPAWEALGAVPLIAEQFVAFRREVSLVCVRGLQGETVFYPLVENHHPGGILGMTLAPAPQLTPGLQLHAEQIGARVLEALDYVGVLTLEFFDTGESEAPLLVNELAPRVHNSGHWTIEGAETSQFENHLRAITGLPLGAATARGPSVLFNILGREPDPAAVLAIPGAHLHRYGKQPAPGRKLGHVTLLAPDTERLIALHRVLEAAGSTRLPGNLLTRGE